MRISRATLRTIGIAWLATLGTAVGYLMLGLGLDQIREGRAPEVSTLVIGLAAVAFAGFAGRWVVREGARRQAQIESEVRHDVVATVFRLGPTAMVGQRTGRIVSTATDAGERVGLNRGTFVAPTIASITSPVLVLALVAATIDLSAALWLLLAFPIAPLAVGGFQRLFKNSSANYRNSTRQLTAAFLDSIQGLTTLRLLGAGRKRAADLAEAAEDVRLKVMKMLLGNQLVILAADTVFWMGFVGLAAALAVDRVREGVISPGQGIALVLLATLLLDPLDRIGQFFYIGMAGRAAGREVAKFTSQANVQELEYSRSVPGKAEEATPETTPAGISVGFNEVYFSYPDGTQVLAGANLHIDAGEHVALVGRSGEGKSTIADLLAGLWLPQSGRVHLGGTSTNVMRPATIRSLVAVVSQSTYLFTGSIADNLRLAQPDATDVNLWHALEIAYLGDDVRAMPQGLDTAVGERGLSLSGGQAQRVAIARAVLRDAPLLILDEPTAHIDVSSERAVIKALSRAGQGRTVITITHRTRTISGSTRVLRLAGGIITEGTVPQSSLTEELSTAEAQG